MWDQTISRRRLSAKILDDLRKQGKGAVSKAAAKAHSHREPGMQAVVDASALSRALRLHSGLGAVYRAIAASYGYEPVTRCDEHTLYRRVKAEAA